MALELRTIPADSDDAVRLVEEMWSTVTAMYEYRGPSPSATTDDFSPPGGAFVAVYEDGVAVAGGGVKRLQDGIGEIKRMYVAPAARGRGVSRLLLAGLEDVARELGYSRLRLDTGEHQHAALRLYPSAGYSEVPDYNGNPYASFWGEKTL
jgi:GNAT superfamily N-acetyltransferase